MELSLMDMIIAVWAGVATALYFNKKKQAEYHVKMMVEMAESLASGDIEVVKEGKTLKFREVKK